jgi:hypothetical protein
MGLDRKVWRISWIVGVPWLAFVSMIYFVMKGRRDDGALPNARGQVPVSTPPGTFTEQGGRI